MLALDAENSGDTEMARQLYLESANLYSIAKYPDLNTEEEKQAYGAQLRVYEAAGQYFQ